MPQQEFKITPFLVICHCIKNFEIRDLHPYYTNGMNGPERKDFFSMGT